MIQIERFLSENEAVQFLHNEKQIQELSHTLFYHTFQNDDFQYDPQNTFFGLKSVYTLKRGAPLGSGIQAVFMINLDEQQNLLRGFQEQRLDSNDLSQNKVFTLGLIVDDQHQEEARKWYKKMKKFMPEITGSVKFDDIRFLPSHYCLGLIEFNRKAIDYNGNFSITVHPTNTYKNITLDIHQLAASIIYSENNNYLQ